MKRKIICCRYEGFKRIWAPIIWSVSCLWPGLALCLDHIISASEELRQPILKLQHYTQYFLLTLVPLVCASTCTHLWAFHFSNTGGKKWAIWPISFRPVQSRGTCVFQSKGGGGRGGWNNGIIFAKCGSEQDFLLGKIVTDLKGQKEGRERTEGRKEVGRKAVRVGEIIGKKGRRHEEGKRKRGRQTKEGWDLDKWVGIYSHICEYLPTHILQVSEQLGTWSKGWLWETEDKQGSQELWERTWAETHDVISITPERGR